MLEVCWCSKVKSFCYVEFYGMVSTMLFWVQKVVAYSSIGWKNKNLIIFGDGWEASQCDQSWWRVTSSQDSCHGEQQNRWFFYVKTCRSPVPGYFEWHYPKKFRSPDPLPTMTLLLTFQCYRQSQVCNVIMPFALRLHVSPCPPWPTPYYA